MIVCWASAAYFQFHSRQFARRLAEEILSYSSPVTLVTLALSYLTVTCHIAYKTLSHVDYFNILGGVKLAYVVATTRCIYTCPVSSGMQPRPPPEVVLYPSRMRFGGHLHLVFSGSEKTHEVTRCKQPLKNALVHSVHVCRVYLLDVMCFLCSCYGFSPVIPVLKTVKRFSTFLSRSSQRIMTNICVYCDIYYYI